MRFGPPPKTDEEMMREAQADTEKFIAAIEKGPAMSVEIEGVVERLRRVADGTVVTFSVADMKAVLAEVERLRGAIKEHCYCNVVDYPPCGLCAALAGETTTP